MKYQSSGACLSNKYKLGCNTRCIVFQVSYKHLAPLPFAMIQQLILYLHSFAFTNLWSASAVQISSLLHHINCFSIFFISTPANYYTCTFTRVWHISHNSRISTDNQRLLRTANGDDTSSGTLSAVGNLSSSARFIRRSSRNRLCSTSAAICTRSCAQQLCGNW